MEQSTTKISDKPDLSKFIKIEGRGTIDDETLKKYGYLMASSYRVKVMNALVVR